MNATQLENLITNALSEDIGDGDHSTLACIDKHVTGKAILKIKEDTVLAGVEIAEKIFKMADASVYFKSLKKDGEIVSNGEIALSLIHI
jgi:nicotinate-nucleotide pyrophosphorylase (carboxylating)